MKLLVFSDTHGYPQLMLDTLIQEREGLHSCFHLGDVARDVMPLQKAFPKLPLYVVQGNCDIGSFDSSEGLTPFGGLLFFYTHGHTLRVKHSLEELWERAKRSGADIALFGHTHAPFYQERDGVHLFNPGSLALPRSGPPTYGRILLQNGAASFDICKFESARSF